MHEVRAKIVGAGLQRTHREVVGVGYRPLPLVRRHHGRLEVFGHAKKRLGRTGGEDSSACPDEGILRFRQSFRRALNLSISCGLPAVHPGLQEVDIGNLFQRLRWNLDLHGAGAARTELFEGLMDDAWDVSGIEDAVSGLGHGPDGVQLIIDFVEHATVDADEVFLYLPGDDEDGG